MNFATRSVCSISISSEQDAVLALSPLAGRSRFAPFSFRETDYLKSFTGSGVRLIDAVRQQVGAAIGHEPQGSICLLTQARSWGLAFNPVSFFYCHEADGQLAAIVCRSHQHTVARALSLCVASARANRSATLISISRWPRPFMFHRFCRAISNTA